jgi:hypothetical protein
MCGTLYNAAEWNDHAMNSMWSLKTHRMCSGRKEGKTTATSRRCDLHDARRVHACTYACSGRQAGRNHSNGVRRYCRYPKGKVDVWTEREKMQPRGDFIERSLQLVLLMDVDN